MGKGKDSWRVGETKLGRGCLSAIGDRWHITYRTATQTSPPPHPPQLKRHDSASISLTNGWQRQNSACGVPPCDSGQGLRPQGGHPKLPVAIIKGAIPNYQWPSCSQVSEKNFNKFKISNSELHHCQTCNITMEHLLQAHLHNFRYAIWPVETPFYKEVF